LFIAAAIFAACVGLRRYLDRPERTDREFGNGRIRLTALWNEGAAFSLPLKRGWVVLLSILILPFVWLFRRRNPIGAGLALGGGLSNLWERVRYGRVYDYVRFPKLPRLWRYVWNLADFAIVLGGTLLALLDRKK
jgi:signal peptidase II